MCGISGIISLENAPVSHAMIVRMNDKVRHRGPDGEGFFMGRNFALGHRRLEIIELTDAGSQPMTSGSYTIVHNGEIYNYIELRDTLKAKGYVFAGQSDTEVILAAYAEWGEQCVQHFVGMWAFMIYDQRKDRLFISRDRFGIKPLCYAVTDRFFLVGSEVKQLLTAGFTPQLNRQTAFEFLQLGMLNCNEQSIFDGVKFLPAGHNLVYDLGTHNFHTYTYFSLDTVAPDPGLSYPDAVRRFRELFYDSIRLHLRSDVEIGACLSGGLDSSSIVCAAYELSGEQRFKTISSCIRHPEFDETRYVDHMTRHIPVRSIRIYPDASDLSREDVINQIVYHQDQPILGGSFYSEHKVFEAAHHHELPVMLDGQGADEYLFGYLYYLTAARGAAGSNAMLQRLRYSNTYHPRFLLRRGLQFLRRRRAAPASDLEWLQSGWVQEAEQNYSERDTLLRSDSLSCISRKSIQSFSIPHQLHSQDRNAMMFSIESRLPFLDHRLVSFAMSLPEDFRLRNGRTKAILRDALAHKLPRKIVQRYHKLGFPGPEDHLFQKGHEQLARSFRDGLDLFPGLFHTDILQLLRATHERRAKEQYLKLFRAYSFIQWAKTFGVSAV